MSDTITRTAVEAAVASSGFRPAVESLTPQPDGTFLLRLYGGIFYTLTVADNIHAGPSTGYNFIKEANGLYVFWTRTSQSKGGI